MQEKMENIAPAGAVVDFNGHPMRMLFINRAIKHLKETTGKSFRGILNAIDGPDGELDYEVLSQLVHAAMMINGQSKPTLDEVREWVDCKSLIETKRIATVDLIAAVNGSYPDAKAGSENPPV
jgi:hypothetical protein